MINSGSNALTTCLPTRPISLMPPTSPPMRELEDRGKQITHGWQPTNHGSEPGGRYGTDPTMQRTKTEAAFSTKYNWLGSRSVDVTIRINDELEGIDRWPRSICSKRCGIYPHATRQCQTVHSNHAPQTGRRGRRLSILVVYLRSETK
jgi:hypothetical protein